MTARHLPHGSGDGIRADGKHPKLFLVCQQLEATWWERSRRGPGALAAPWGQCHPLTPALPHTRPRVPAAPRAAPRPAPGSAPPALPLPCPRLCQQLTPSGCRIRPSPAVWTSARAGECCRGWEERSGHRCSRLRGADAGCVASGSATAPGDFPLSYLLLTWKNTLGAASSPAPQAGRWVGKSPQHPWAGGCEGRRRPPPCCPTLPSPPAALAARSARLVFHIADTCTQRGQPRAHTRAALLGANALAAGPEAVVPPCALVAPGWEEQSRLDGLSIATSALPSPGDVRWVQGAARCWGPHGKRAPPVTLPRAALRSLLQLRLCAAVSTTAGAPGAAQNSCPCSPLCLAADSSPMTASCDPEQLEAAATPLQHSARCPWAAGWLWGAPGRDEHHPQDRVHLCPQMGRAAPVPILTMPPASSTQGPGSRPSATSPCPAWQRGQFSQRVCAPFTGGAEGEASLGCMGVRSTSSGFTSLAELQMQVPGDSPQPRLLCTSRQRGGTRCCPPCWPRVLHPA